MSLLPVLFSDWWEDLDRPHRLFDQHFGINLRPEDLLENIAPSSDQILIYRPNRSVSRRRYRPYTRPRQDRGASTVQADKDKFMVTLDVQQFSPDEINVKVADKHVVVEAKHEEKEDEHGWISRQFLRKYLIPSQCDVDKVESHLSSDGVLTITAPRKQQAIESNERPIQIQFTGQPAVNQVSVSNASVSNASIPNGSFAATENQEQGQDQKIPNTPQRGRRATLKAN
ncbi:protein lethal(2)essential for life-like [Belonocnema kinseyi]|uniref:protein lethal(2)essential for life-like n=1 Tax=Belonocnema kinseyi TaxID=2817044 RepID=UPI00143DCF9C|nr:protein lethal(2)essential for life-like [Belonocnema kinseyi]